MDEYLDYWKQTFNVREETDRITFSTILIVHITILIFGVIVWTFSDSWWFLIIYFGINMVPTITLTIRRFKTNNTSMLYFIWLLVPVAGIMMVIAKAMGEPIGNGVGDKAMDALADQQAISSTQSNNMHNRTF